MVELFTDNCRYYNTVHPTLPILPHNESTLNRLTTCPPKLRETFFLAVEACVRSFAANALPPMDISLTSMLQQSVDALHAAEHTLRDTDNSRQFHNNLVFCQSLILLAAASDRPGPGIVGSTTKFLGQMAGHMNDTGINDPRTLNLLKEQDQEMFQMARRVFWTAFILDRFHAASRSKDLALPLHPGSLSRDDFSALGEVGYYLARESSQICFEIASN